MMLSLRGGGAAQRILIVDDDVAIHRIVEKVLTVGLGGAEPEGLVRVVDDAPKPYALSFASNGQEAVMLAERAQRLGTPFGLALVDMRMPGWDGIETVTRLYRIEPTLQVALCSAYMDYSWQEILERVQRPGLRQLRKPWTGSQMLATVHELSRRARDGGTGAMSAYPQSRAPQKPSPGR